MKLLFIICLFLFGVSFVQSQTTRRAKHVDVYTNGVLDLIYQTDSAKKVRVDNDTLKIYLINNKVKTFYPSSYYNWSYTFSKITYEE